MSLTFLIIFGILFGISILLFIHGVVTNNGDTGFVGLFGSLIFGMMLLTIYMVSTKLSNGFAKDWVFENTGSEAIQVRYIQYNPWSENSMESVILMPGQAKLKHGVREISRTKINMN